MRTAKSIIQRNSYSVPMLWTLLAGVTLLSVFSCKPKESIKAPSQSEVNQHLDSGSTPLIEAMKESSSAKALPLLEQGAFVDFTDNQGRTPLHHASENCFEDGVALLLNYRPSIHKRDVMGQTPLHKAAANGCSGIVALLLEKGAKVDAFDKFGQDPLMLASKNLRLRVVELLLEQDAFPTLQNNRKETALHMVISSLGDSIIVKNKIETTIKDSLRADSTGAEKKEPDVSKAGDDQNVSKFRMLTYKVWYGMVDAWNSGKNWIATTVGLDRDEKDRKEINEKRLSVLDRINEKEERALAIIKLLLKHGANPEQPGPGGITSRELAQQLKLQEVGDLLSTDSSNTDSGP